MLKQLPRVLAITCALAFAAPALAVPITGEVSMAGSFFTNTGNLQNATAVGFNNAWTTGGSGTYAPVEGQTVFVVYNNFTFSPSLVGPVSPLWRFSFQGINYSFVMTDVAVIAQNSSLLSLYGVGTLYADGYDATEGFWEFSGQDVNGRFKFSSESTAVPEPDTLGLLGLSLVGLGLIRRRKAT